MTISTEKADRESAAIWVARHVSGGEFDRSAFEAWLGGHTRRQAYFDELYATCMDPVVGQALANVSSRARRVSVRLPSAFRVALPVAAAAAITLVVVQSVRQQNQPATIQEFAAATGEVKMVPLKDGSTVMLGSNTRITVRFSDSGRQVTLTDGNAYFDVAHDAARPFTVSAGQARTVVLGTKFDLALSHGDVDLAVERGLVRFEAQNQAKAAVLVKAGYHSQFHDGRPDTPSHIRPDRVGAWREGWIEAEDMPVSRLVAEFQRWSGRTIDIESPSIARQRVAGRFRLTGDPRGQLESLAYLSGSHLIERNEHYVLVKNK
ncbi:FecR domain-containing protein [Sphingomonadaceae bacterium jetA1]|jgi:transmembrane sensor|uniref:FecR family protein n=1 Tax=Facivitalis istanbulensis TaxID=3075838 RepID=UPI00347849E5